MKNMKVRTKLNLILVLVILLVALGGTVSVKDMEDVKDKALETMEASSRQSYDDSIKEQVEVVISLLSEINDAYKAGTYTLDEAKKIAADEVRQMRYGEAGYFWIDQSDGTNVVLLGSDTEGTNRMETKDAKGYQMVKEIIRVAGRILPFGMMSVRSIITMGTERYIPLLTEKKRRNILHRLKRKYRKRKLPSGVMWRLPRRPFMKMQNRH